MNQWVLFLPVFVWLAVLTYYLSKTANHYQKLMKGTGRGNLTQVLEKILEELNLNKASVAALTKSLQEEIDQSVYHIQKVGILRFNPFADTGGDQSFVLAVLDGTDSGMVLTSLHSRGITRWYAKNVKNGKGIDHQLSEEEEKAIKQARPLKVEK